MAITYTWTIDEMFTYPNMDGRENVVFGVSYGLTGTDGAHTATVSGNIPLPLPDGGFTAYADLTEDEVAGWVQDALGAERVAEIEVAIYRQINDQITPPVVMLPLPWGA
jgi:hypothetical protein